MMIGRIAILGAIAAIAWLGLAPRPALARPDAGIEAKLKTVRAETERAMQAAPPAPDRLSIWRVPGAGYEWQDCPNGCPTMIVVPAGQVTVKDRRGAAITVTIGHALGVSKFPITVADWVPCVRAGVCHTNGEFNDYAQGKYPVASLNWQDAQDYVAWLSHWTGATYRLLSEAEYHYINGAGAQTRYWWGDVIGEGFANCRGCGPGLGQRATPAASFFPNAFGLYDTTGDVWSWTADVYRDSLDATPRDGSPNLAGDPGVRVRRGGGWTDAPGDLSLDSRAPAPIGERLATLGLRVARVF